MADKANSDLEMDYLYLDIFNSGKLRRDRYACWIPSFESNQFWGFYVTRWHVADVGTNSFHHHSGYCIEPNLDISVELVGFSVVGHLFRIENSFAAVKATQVFKACKATTATSTANTTEWEWPERWCSSWPSCFDLFLEHCRYHRGVATNS